MYSMVTWPIISAVWAAMGFVGLDHHKQLAPINPIQQMFIQRHISQKDALSKFAPDELGSWVSDDYMYLNRILKDEGFGIQLDPFAPGDFGVVSILDVLVEWLHEGSKTIVHNNHIDYPAVEHKKGAQIYLVDAYPYPVACIKTKTEDTVWVAIADEPCKSFALLDHINKIRKSDMHISTIHDKVIAPMVDYDESCQLDWLLGLRLQNWYICQALQQTKFKMNEHGAHVKSAVAIACRCSLPVTKPYVINKPFFVWIERPGLDDPIFVGYMAPEYWSDPGQLEAH